MARLLEDNDPPDPARLSVGQTLVVRYPKQMYRVRAEMCIRDRPSTNSLSMAFVGVQNAPQLTQILGT